MLGTPQVSLDGCTRKAPGRSRGGKRHLVPHHGEEAFTVGLGDVCEPHEHIFHEGASPESVMKFHLCLGIVPGAKIHALWDVLM
jgi:hypothetical protein